MINLNEIFKSSERVNVEVNAAQGGIPNSIWETYSSFTNTFGGTIILGIGKHKNSIYRHGLAHFLVAQDLNSPIFYKTEYSARPGVQLQTALVFNVGAIFNLFRRLAPFSEFPQAFCHTRRFFQIIYGFAVGKVALLEAGKVP